MRNWFSGLVALVATAAAISDPRPLRADYRGPVQFTPPIFTSIRPQPIATSRIPHTTIPRENIAPPLIPRGTIAQSPIPREAIPRGNFQFSSSIFGYVHEGPPRKPGSQYVPDPLRPTTRRRALGW